jgi:hypothetical protein
MCHLVTSCHRVCDDVYMYISDEGESDTIHGQATAARLYSAEQRHKAAYERELRLLGIDVHSYEAIHDDDTRTGQQLSAFKPLYLSARSRVPIHSKQHAIADSTYAAINKPMIIFLALPACEVHIIPSECTASAVVQASSYIVEPLSQLYAAEVSGAFVVIRRRMDQSYLLLLSVAVWAEFSRIALAMQRCSTVRTVRQACLNSSADCDGSTSTIGVDTGRQLHSVAYSSCSCTRFLSAAHKPEEAHCRTICAQHWAVK